MPTCTSVALEDKIQYCEHAYKKRGLPVIFRLIEPLDLHDLDSKLADKGYQVFHPTCVMGLELSPSGTKESTKGILREHRLDTWLEIFSQLSEYSLEKQPLHKKILEKIPTTSLFVSGEISGQPVTCGLGILHDDLFGLFDIVTHPNQRNQGFATQLVREMLIWGKENGVKQAYLQVMASNAPARYVYTKLGFKDLYPYWYRVPKSI